MKSVLPRIGLLSAIVLNLGLIACGDSQTSGAKVDDYLKVSQRYQAQGQFRAAIIEAQNAIQKAPDNPQAFTRLANIYNELGAGKKASELILKLDKIDDPELILTLHEAYLQQGKYKSANALLADHTELRQTHPEQFNLALAATQAGLGNAGAAETAYHNALDLNPKNYEAMLGLARLAVQLNNLTAAMTWLERIPAEDKHYTASAALKSNISYAGGDLASAEENLNQALFTLKDTDLPTPEWVDVLQKLIEVLTLQGRSNEAYIYSKKLAEANPLGHELNQKFQQAIEKYQQGELKEAEALLLEIHQQTAGNAMSGQMLGMLNYLQGNVDRAEKLLSEYVDPETASTETKLLLASAQLGSNKPDQALQVLREDAENGTAKPAVLATYGLAALQVGETDKGIEYIRAALRKQPGNSKLRVALAQQYANTAQLDKAREELAIAFAKTPADTRVQSALIETLLLLNAVADAEKVSSQILDDYPKAGTSYSLAGHVAAAKGEFNSARKYFARAQKLNPQDISSLYGLAKVAFMQKRWSQAEQYFRKIIAADPQQLNAYRGILQSSSANGSQQAGIEFLQGLDAALLPPKLALAERFIETGDSGAALEQLQLVRSLQPESRDAAELTLRALLGKSRKLLLAGKLDGAREAAITALQIAPQSLPLLQQLARIDLADKQPGEAVKTLARMQEIAPEHPQLHELRADIALSQGDTSKAIKSYRLAWTEGRSDSSAGKLYQLLTQSEPAMAQEFLREWQSENPDSPVLLTLLAQTKEKAGDTNGAIKLYETAIALAPESPAVLNNLAWLYHTKGDKRAREYAAKAYQLAPGSAAIADTYGWILAKNGEKEKSIEVLSNAVSLAPGVKEIAEHLEQARAM